MRIIIDGQKVPVNIRVNRDVLTTLKAIAQTMHWRIVYDTPKELVYIYSKSYIETPPAERPIPEITEPESNRLLGKIICVDPGHGGNDPGAVGPSGTREKDNTLSMALLLRDKLESNGATVILTRDTDKEVAAPEAAPAEELAARVAIANDAHADIFVSIHNDSFTSHTAIGTTSFHYGDPESVKLAGLIQSGLIAELGTKDRGVRFASFYTLRYAAMPSVLTEVAFISNPEEEVLLASLNGRIKAAESIFQGIVKYFKV
jgi:N-acetylmuramoyl-L-alanine amidase